MKWEMDVIYMKLKIVISILLVIIMLFGICSTCFASGIDPKDFNPSNNPITSNDYEKAFEKTTKIVSAITTVGLVISVIAVMVMGIIYMFGSIEQRVQYQKTMLPVFIGAVLLFSASTIVSIIYGIMESVNN